MLCERRRNGVTREWSHTFRIRGTVYSFTSDPLPLVWWDPVSSPVGVCRQSRVSVTRDKTRDERSGVAFSLTEVDVNFVSEEVGLKVKEYHIWNGVNYIHFGRFCFRERCWDPHLVVWGVRLESTVSRRTESLKEDWRCINIEKRIAFVVCGIPPIHVPPVKIWHLLVSLLLIPSTFPVLCSSVLLPECVYSDPCTLQGWTASVERSSSRETRPGLLRVIGRWKGTTGVE